MQINIVLIFFIYGLAFFCLGVAMLLESGRSPLLAEAKVLLPLAFFGFLHGIHEWLEIAQIYTNWFVPPLPDSLYWLRLTILILSFSCLFWFSLAVFKPHQQILSRNLVLRTVFLIFLITVLVFLISFVNLSWHPDWRTHLEITVRYLLGAPGALLAGIAIIYQSQLPQYLELKSLVRVLLVTGIAFIIYALTQVIVPLADIFPAYILNTSTFFNLFGIPVQVFRAVLAVIITITLLQAVRLAEIERNRRFVSAQEARVQALETIQQQLIEREQLRQNLLHHTVRAQEDERARIARELHDETAQLLTAFSLHLTKLQNSSTLKKEDVEEIVRLQELRVLMAKDINRLIHDLRPVLLDDLGISAGLQYLADEAKKRLGLDVDVKIMGSPMRLIPVVETVLYRVAQEGLTNIARHSGASNAHIKLRFNQENVVLLVQDEGRGFNYQSSGDSKKAWGLAGMRERVESIDGSLKIHSEPGKGTTIAATIPYIIVGDTIPQEL